MQFQKISILPHIRDSNFLGGRGEGSVRPKKIKKCMKINRNFHRGGVLQKIPFQGGGGGVWIFSGLHIALNVARPINFHNILVHINISAS